MVCVCVWVVQSCLILDDPMDYSLPGSSVHGILQARTLEWVAIPFSRGTSQFRDWIRIFCIIGRFFIVCHQGVGCPNSFSSSWKFLLHAREYYPSISVRSEDFCLNGKKKFAFCNIVSTCNWNLSYRARENWTAGVKPALGRRLVSSGAQNLALGISHTLIWVLVLLLTINNCVNLT